MSAAAALAFRDVACTFVSKADPGQRYDEIWSNPPIRVGKAVLHALLRT